MIERWHIYGVVNSGAHSNYCFLFCGTAVGNTKKWLTWLISSLWVDSFQKKVHANISSRSREIGYLIFFLIGTLHFGFWRLGSTLPVSGGSEFLNIKVQISLLLEKILEQTFFSKLSTKRALHDKSINFSLSLTGHAQERETFLTFMERFCPLVIFFHFFTNNSFYVTKLILWSEQKNYWCYFFQFHLLNIFKSVQKMIFWVFKKLNA